MAELTLRITGSHYTSNDPDNPSGWYLSVEDYLSGTVLVDVSIKPEDFHTILAGGHIKVAGRVANDLHRVGKKMRVWQQMVPRERTPGYKEPDTLARDWATANSPEPFDTLEILRQNNGTKAIYRVWEDNA